MSDNDLKFIDTPSPSVATDRIALKAGPHPLLVSITHPAYKGLGHDTDPRRPHSLIDPTHVPVHYFILPEE